LTSPVSITARAVISAFGSGEEVLWNGLLAGASAFEPCPVLTGSESSRIARIPDPPLPLEDGQDRTLSLVTLAARQLLESPAWRTVDPARLGVAIGTTQGPVLTWQAHQQRMAVDPSYRPAPPGLAGPALAVARLLGAGGPVQNPSLACASGSVAIALAQGWIRSGACDAVVAGGVDVLSRFVHAGFSALRALAPDRPRPFDRDRAGLALGEGAALLLLQAGALEGHARVSGWGLSADAHHLTGPDPSGSGLARAIQAALADAAIAPSKVDFINAHGTATVFNDLMESKAIAQVFGPAAPRVPVNSIKGAVGHTLAAAGAIEAVVCTLVLERGLVPPTAGLQHLDPAIALDVVHGTARAGSYQRVLSTSSGFGGVNSALVLERS